MLTLLRKILGWCPMCQTYFTYPKKRRMNTAYIEEKSNYCCVCKDCYQEVEAYWDERWSEYNSGRY
jgi:hypothetical protein